MESKLKTKKINFEALEMYTDIKHTHKIVKDVREEFAQIIYERGAGVKMHALAYKVLGSHGETEFTEQECKIIKMIAEQIAPFFIDAIYNVLNQIEDENS